MLATRPRILAALGAFIALFVIAMPAAAPASSRPVYMVCQSHQDGNIPAYVKHPHNCILRVWTGYGKVSPAYALVHLHWRGWGGKSATANGRTTSGAFAHVVAHRRKSNPHCRRDHTLFYIRFRVTINGSTRHLRALPEWNPC